MAKNQESINRSLFDLLRTKGYHPTLLDTSGKEIPVPEEAEVFQFKFSKEGKEYGTVTVTIDGLHKLVIYFGDEVANSEKEQHDDGDVSWYSLLRQLKRFALSHQLSFEIKNIDNLKYDMAKRAHMKKQEQISEGYYPMGKKASYSDNIPQTKIIIQHSRQIEEGEQRYRNVDKIFVENMNGERFLIPTNKPGIARVYARHIAEGGTPYDERGKHITSLVEEYQKMAGFVRATRSHQFNENAQKLVEQGINHYANLRETLNKMTGRKGYVNYFESYTPSLMEAGDEDTTINELFVQETLDPRIESVMPILQRLNKTVSEMKEVSELSEWADSLVEDEGIQSQNPVGIPEGRLDGLPDEDGPVVNAITRRILMQRVDLLSKFGPEKVAQAITAVADDLGDWIGPDDEIGSSDVSAWVKRVEQELSSLGEGEPGDLEHELERQDYEHDRERDEQAEKEMNEAERPGLWANIHAKRERIKHGSGEKMRKPGSKGAPTAQNFRDAAKEGIGEGNEILSPDTYELIDDYIAKIEPDADREEIAQSIIKGYIHPSELEYALQPDLDEGILDTIKKGAKAVGKAIVGKDDDELLADLKKRAGVRNPQTGKPSMAISDVEKVDEGEANLEKALDTLSGSWSNWNKDESTNPNIESYWYDDGEGNHYASGRIEHDLRTGKITVDYEGEYGEEVKGTFDSVGAAMNALRGGYPASHGGKAPNYDSLANKTLAGPDDLYKTDKAGKKGTLTKARMQGMKASSPYTMRGGPKGVLPEGEFAGDYATGEAGQWRNKGPKANKPATVGDLVGASESMQNTLDALTEMDSEGYKGTRDDGDSKGPEGKAKEIKGKDFAKAAEKSLNKEMDKAHPKTWHDVDKKLGKQVDKMSQAEKVKKGFANPNTVKEGQEDLDAILRIIKK